MQSTDVSTLDVGRDDTKLNVDNDNDGGVIEPETLTELSNDVVVTKSGDSLEVDEGNEDMEVNFIENRGSKAGLEGSENLIEGRGLEMEDRNVGVGVDFVENSGSRAVLEGSENLIEGRDVEIEDGDGGMEVDFVENRGSGAVVEGSEDLIEGRDIEIEDGNEGMEVDFVENRGSKAVLEGSEILVEGRERISLEGEMGSVNVEEVCVEDGKGKLTNEVDFDGVDNQEGLGKASFNSCAKMLFPKMDNKDIDGMHVKAGGIVNVVEANEPSSVAESQAVGGISNVAAADKENIGDDISHASDKENIGDDVTHVGEGRVSVPKGGSHGDKRRKKGGFYTYDLVWGKVRSHPWWPAQIFELEDASEQATKHFKPKSYLLAYFGDKTFAWNEEAKLKPFAPHFSQMAKQSTLEAFEDAVNCALDEAARRAEFGLSCHCIADDVYSRLKIQVVNNAGIQENLSIREGKDRFYTASTFEPVKFLHYVKHLAQVPHVEEKARLEHVVTHAQMSAFYRWKGCYHLAEFGQLIGYVNNEADAPVSGKSEGMLQMISDANVVPRDKMEDEMRTQKRKKLSGDKGNTTKKVKRLSDSMRKKGRKPVSKEDDSEESEEIIGRKLISSSMRKKSKKTVLKEDDSDDSDESDEIIGRKLVSSSIRKKDKKAVSKEDDSDESEEIIGRKLVSSSMRKKGKRTASKEDDSDEIIGRKLISSSMRKKGKKTVSKENDSDESEEIIGRKFISSSMLKKGKKTVSKEDDSDESEEIIGRKFISSSVKRRKQAKLSSNDSKLKENSPQITPPRESKQGLRVGESMLRAALQLSQPSPLLKVDVSDEKSTKGNGKRKQHQKLIEFTSFKKSSPENILSKFLLAAVDPLKEHSFLSSMISFFSDFRDSVVQDIVFLTKHGESAGYDIVDKSVESPSVEMADRSSSGNESKEIGSDGKITEVPELQSSMTGEEMVPVDPENIVSESEPLDEDVLLEETPTALTLKFSDMDAIPSEAKLNQIFSAFGPLKDSETEVLPKKNCARVVFKRQVDAETAFSSSGKFETFGASLVCYQLNYSPSPRKSPSPEAKRRRKDGNLVEGIVA